MTLNNNFNKLLQHINLVVRQGIRPKNVGLPEPDFSQHGPHFVVTIWRDWLTEKVMEQLGLTGQEKKLVSLLKTIGRIGNKEYQEAFNVSKPTASRHLVNLTEKRCFNQSRDNRERHILCNFA